MTRKKISYFQLNLLAFLEISHPEKLNDTDFITNKSEQALQCYEQEIKKGINPIHAEEIANELLFSGIHFSRYDTLVEVLWNEFSEYINENESLEFAKKILPESEKIFARYTLNDDFAYSSEFDQLYLELTEWFQQWIEEYELQ